MDMLVQHCLRELSFEGDLGCDVSRLRDFVIGFYSQQAASLQTIDDAFCAFVWSIIVNQLNVRVGVIPPGGAMEVYIAPQNRSKKKVIVQGEDAEEVPPALDVIDDAEMHSLEQLKADYGDNLRIAVDPGTSFAAITGTHLRPARLTPMVYTTLQFIARARENGVSVVELGKKSSYDQKTCFYLIKILVELDLVVKVRRAGVGTHLVIHKFFYQRNELWQRIRTEEDEAEAQAAQSPPPLEPPILVDPLLEDTRIQFEPMDSRHLSSLPLVRARVVKLLRSSKNCMHASNNMLITLGFANPTKTDRRFFQTRIRELIQQGLIERVLVPNNTKKASGSTTRCFRLVSSEAQEVAVDESIIVQPEDVELEDEEPGENVNGGVKMNVSVHKQVIDLLEEAGTMGMTLNDISEALCNFDRRTIELLLTRAEKNPPPSHLSDLGVAELMETHGRERRHRYYTVKSYRALVSRENLDPLAAGYASVDLRHANCFAPVDRSLFYDDLQDMVTYQDEYKSKEQAQSGRKAKKHPKNPILPDGTVKRGRPKKIKVESKKRNIEEAEPTPGDQDTEGRRRSKRRKVEADDSNVIRRTVSTSQPDEQRGAVASSGDDAPIVHFPKKRYRPRKTPAPPPQTLPETISHTTTRRVSTPPIEQPRTRKRRRLGEHGQTARRVLAGAEREPASSPAGRGDSLLLFPSMNAYDMPREDAATIQNTLRAGAHPEERPLATVDTNPIPISAREDDTSAAAQTDSLPLENPSTGCISYRDTMGDPTSMQQLRTDSMEPLMLIEDKDHLPFLRGPTSLLTANPISSNARSKVNVSHLRRENELQHVLESMGGVANIQAKEFLDAHLALVEERTRAGEPTSAPVGSRLDKRTLAATLDSMELRGRIKSLKTSIPTHTGALRSVCVVYTSGLPEKDLMAFLAALSQNTSNPSQQAAVKTITQRVDYGFDENMKKRASLSLRQGQPHSAKDDRRRKTADQAEQLFSHDARTIRDVLLAERTTVAQLQGYIVGKAARLRQFHLHSLAVFETQTSSPHVVSLDERVMHLSYYRLDLPLSFYCSFVASLEYDEELVNFMETDVGRRTLVKDLPPRLHSFLQIGRARARSRLLELLLILGNLKLVTPLFPSASDVPWLRCKQNGQNPTSFDAASLDDWNAASTAGAPVYWHFNRVAPLQLQAKSETSSPFWKHIPVSSYADGVAYWVQLESLCLNRQGRNVIGGSGSPSATVMLDGDGTLTKIFQRTSTWNADYVLTWHQCQYLRTFVDMSTGRTPLQAVGGDDSIKRICWVSSAPETAVRHFFANTQEKLKMKHERASRRAAFRSTEDEAKHSLATQARLAEKGAEARLQREQAWEQLICQLYPEGLQGSTAVRVRPVRARFFLAGSVRNTEKWEKEIAAAVQGVSLATSKVLKQRRPPNMSAPTTMALSSPGVNSVQTSIQSLIAHQGPAREPTQKRKVAEKNKLGATIEPSEKIARRRHRFQWTREYEDLARDAYAIIKARCRNGPRLDLAAFEQVFHAVPRNSVRQRLTHMRSIPGNDAYMKRLEDRWYDLWIQWRGTPLLPDDDPCHSSNFDLVKHIEFLRNHIDKNALRVGFVLADEKSDLVLPETVDQLIAGWDVVNNDPVAPTWDFFWNAIVEEGREKQMQRQAFTCAIEKLPMVQVQVSDLVHFAESALKMVLGTPNSVYDTDEASRLLHGIGDDIVAIATSNLLSRGVLSKTTRTPSTRPGRALKISELNQNAVAGSIPRDTFQDAVALDEISTEEVGWREWPLLATDGDTAALLQLVSESKVEFDIDLSRSRAARALLDWNSKKADDDDIETVLQVRFHSIEDSTPEEFLNSQTSPSVHAMELEDAVTSNHGFSKNGAIASCRKHSDGLADCAVCIDDAELELFANLSAEDATLARRIRDKVHQAAGNGLSRAALLADIPDMAEHTLAVVGRMTNSSPPIMFWVGYSSVVLVSSVHLQSWTVVVSESPCKRIFPRRWCDTHGFKNDDLWKAALKAVVGLVVFRPGISQVEIRWRLRAVYDRQEIGEVLQYLYDTGSITRKSSRLVPDAIPIAALDEEETTTFWFLNNSRHWYQL